MDDLFSAHRAEEYTYRVPTPPRIVVPPPTLNAAAVPDFSLSTNSPFLADIDYDKLVTTNAILEWTYERRREAQMVLPFLYLGPMLVAKDRNFLQREGITMLLAVRQKHTFESKMMLSALEKAHNLGLQTSSLDIVDNQHLIAAFPAFTQTINQHLSAVYRLHQSQPAAPPMGKVLVFCESGNERSAGAVAAYMMDMFTNVDYVKAMQLCQAQRFCVNYDDSMKRILQSYWDILKAKRDVGPALRDGDGSTEELAGSGVKRSTKRSFHVDDDGDDAEMGGTADNVDHARFERRSFAPFVDMSQ